MTDPAQFDYRVCTYRLADSPRHVTPYEMTARELMTDWAAMAEGTLQDKLIFRGTTFVIFKPDGFELHGCFYEIICWCCREKFVDVHWDDPSDAIEICPSVVLVVRCRSAIYHHPDNVASH